MYHKKYGKITFSAWLNAELEECSLVMTVFVGLLLAASCIAVRSVSGSPHQMILQLDIKDLLPPVWLLSALRFLAMLTVGCAAGMVLGHKRSACQIEKYKGGMLFVLLAVLELLWYPTLFYWGLLLLTLIECLCMLLLAIAVTACFFKVSRFAGYIMVAHAVWLAYLLILAFAILFRN